MRGNFRASVPNLTPIHQKRKKGQSAGGAGGVSENHEYLDQGLYHLGSMKICMKLYTPRISLKKLGVPI